MNWRFAVEVALVRVALAASRALGPVGASNAGGWLTRTLGPLLPVSRVAYDNLRRAMPELDAAARRRIVRGAWDNLGRTMGEFPHVAGLKRTATGPGWEMVGEDTLLAQVQRSGPLIFFSGHIGNWELLPVAAAAYGVQVSGVYRAATNPGVDAIIMNLRQSPPGAAVPMFPKGAMGARRALQHLSKGGTLAFLMDQKMNDGVKARFFGLPAMTASAPAAMALRSRCPVVPAYVQRLGPARFRLVCESPLTLPDTGDRQADILAVTQTVNDHLERWIRNQPESWLWMHRRWPKQS